jgi:hypothetical protein
MKHLYREFMQLISTLPDASQRATRQELGYKLMGVFTAATATHAVEAVEPPPTDVQGAALAILLNYLARVEVSLQAGTLPASAADTAVSTLEAAGQGLANVAKAMDLAFSGLPAAEGLHVVRKELEAAARSCSAVVQQRKSARAAGGDD